jgi:hypothetical protein
MYLFYFFLNKKAILYTLRGLDLETNDKMGFENLIAKCELSESRNKWNYLVKNLLILDRIVSDNLFL